MPHKIRQMSHTIHSTTEHFLIQVWTPWEFKRGPVAQLRAAGLGLGQAWPSGWPE